MDGVPPTAFFSGQYLLPHAEMVGLNGAKLHDLIFIHRNDWLKVDILLKLGQWIFSPKYLQMRHREAELISCAKTNRKVMEIQ